MKLSLRQPPFPGFAVLAGALAVLVGGAVLTGWALGIAVLTSVLPGGVSVKPNTAVAFVLIGLAVLLTRPPSTVHRPRPATLDPQHGGPTSRRTASRHWITCSVRAGLPAATRVSCRRWSS